MNGKVKLIVAFGTGAVAGMVVIAGAVELMGRQGWHVGGEALIVPLMALLVYFGWSVGTEYNHQHRSYERAQSYRHGYREGLRKAAVTALMDERQKDMLAQHNIRY